MEGLSGMWLTDGCQDGTPTSKTFEHVASEIGAEEAEEVGVEHLLRSVTSPAVCLCSLHCYLIILNVQLTSWLLTKDLNSLPTVFFIIRPRRRSL